MNRKGVVVLSAFFLFVAVSLFLVISISYVGAQEDGDYLTKAAELLPVEQGGSVLAVGSENGFREYLSYGGDVGALFGVMSEADAKHLGASVASNDLDVVAVHDYFAGSSSNDPKFAAFLEGVGDSKSGGNLDSLDIDSDFSGYVQYEEDGILVYGEGVDPVRLDLLSIEEGSTVSIGQNGEVRVDSVAGEAHSVTVSTPGAVIRGSVVEGIVNSQSLFTDPMSISVTKGDVTIGTNGLMHGSADATVEVDIGGVHMDSTFVDADSSLQVFGKRSFVAQNVDVDVSSDFSAKIRGTGAIGTANELGSYDLRDTSYASLDGRQVTLRNRGSGNIGIFPDGEGWTINQGLSDGLSSASVPNTIEGGIVMDRNGEVHAQARRGSGLGITDLSNTQRLTQGSCSGGTCSAGGCSDGSCYSGGSCSGGSCGGSSGQGGQGGGAAQAQGGDQLAQLLQAMQQSLGQLGQGQQEDSSSTPPTGSTAQSGVAGYSGGETSPTECVVNGDNGFDASSCPDGNCNNCVNALFAYSGSLSGSLSEAEVVG